MYMLKHHHKGSARPRLIAGGGRSVKFPLIDRACVQKRHISRGWVPYIGVGAAAHSSEIIENQERSPTPFPKNFEPILKYLMNIVICIYENYQNVPRPGM